MSRWLPSAQAIVFAVLFTVCASCMALAAAAHVHKSKPNGPPPHVMHFQCATLSFVVVQQAYYLAHFITRMVRPTAAFLGTKCDIEFLLFFVSFGMPVTFALTYKINEFGAPWKTAPMPLQWRLVVADTALAWVILIVLWAWLITEATQLYRRFGPRVMWHVSLPTLEVEPSLSDSDIVDCTTDKSSLNHSDSSHAAFNR